MQYVRGRDALVRQFNDRSLNTMIGFLLLSGECLER